LKVVAGRVENFWVLLRFMPSPVKLWQPDSSLAVTFRLMEKNPKEKLYVAIGKAGLEQLLEDLMWWPPTGEKPNGP
jgi:hypothetical protein